MIILKLFVCFMSLPVTIKVIGGVTTRFVCILKTTERVNKSLLLLLPNRFHRNVLQSLSLSRRRRRRSSVGRIESDGR